ncbi:MAG: hypothetical protein ETSY1_26505 [Candidatus Entotheonella factor]|uniref:DAHL domain-containing protein n=1 Tax=Entotheonella factor TaxID=1429438 RepID=W4LEP2_ENTF1|nr:MAG: hypothetical protein ETSY1_26505 [Candidatus Entotheonella factor]
MLGFAGIAIYCYVQTQRVNWDHHTTYASAALRMQGVNADLNKNILKVRYRLLEYYDVLVSQFRQIKNLQTTLSDIPPAIDEPGQAEISQPLEILTVLIKEKEEVLESFKAQNAVLKNSVRYLPVAMDESGEDIENTDLKQRLANLIRDTLHYNRDADRQLGRRIQSQLQVFSSQRDSMPPSPEREVMDQILAHVRTVFTQTPFVNTLTDTLTWMPLGQWSNALDQAYQRHHGRLVETTKQYRLYMYLASGAALVLGLLAAFMDIRKPALVPVALELPVQEPQDEPQMTTTRTSNLSKLKNRRDERRRASVE